MKTRFWVYFTSIFCALAVLVSGPFAFADKGDIIKAGRKALTGKTKGAKISPKTSSSAARKGVSRVAVERAAADAATRGATVSTLPASKKKVPTAAGLKMPSEQVLETPELNLPGLSVDAGAADIGTDVEVLDSGADIGVEDTGTNLTGVEVLQTYFPAWRQELGGMFSNEQLDAVERTIAATDEWMFTRGEDGELQIRNPDEWDYEARFLTLLQNSGVSFTEKQIKQLVGGTGIKGFTLNRYFTLTNLSGFVKAHPGTFPRQGILGKNGQQLTLADLRARAQQGDEQAEKLAAELELGKRISKALRNWPQDSPEYQELKALYDANRKQIISKTRQQVLTAYEQWLAKHPGTSPRMSITGGNGEHLTLAELRVRARQGDEEAGKLANELELGRSIGHALKSWPKNSPEYQELKALYDANRNQTVPKTPQQVISMYKQWTVDHPGTSPRMTIPGENGQQLTLADLRARAQQEDKQAGKLADELELGHSIHNALHRWPKDSAEYQELKALYNEYRNIASRKSTNELYQDLVAHIQDYKHYPMYAESSLYRNIYNRLRRYQSTMVDGKYQDPWLQKIYELKTAVENAPEGKFTLTPDGQGGYILEIEEPAAEELDVTAPHQIEEPAPAVPSPHALRLRITEDIKNMVLAARDQAALERHQFYPWLRSMQQNHAAQIVNTETWDALWAISRALAFDHRTGQNRRAVTYLLQTVNNYVGVLGEDRELGYFNKLIYRGRLEPGMLPQADLFHVATEQHGMSWDGDVIPQVGDVNRTYAQAIKRGETPGVFLDGDEDMITFIGIAPRVDIQTVKQDLESMLKQLLPPGFEVRMGLHELGISGSDMTKFRRGDVHIHLEHPATSEEIEDGFLTDISIRLDVKARRFAGWMDYNVNRFYPYSDAKIAENYHTLFDAFLDQEAKNKLDKLAR